VTPGRIDLKVVEDRLGIARDCVATLRRLPRATLEAFLADERTPLAAESALRRAIEALFDTARHVLSKGFGHGALEYRDVARKAHERGLVTDPGLAGRFEQIAGYRNRLIHFYDAVTTKELFGILRDDLQDLEALADTLENAAKRLAKQT
jgi:uncharacterized protein YutE (UPF0331/DUF86 family)